MEPKKTKKADIEKNISTYFSLGLVIALSLSLIAFEWMSEGGTESFIDIGSGEPIDIDYTPLTIQDKEKIEPPKIPAETFIIREDWVPTFDSIYWGPIDPKEGDPIEKYIPKHIDPVEDPEEFYLIPGEMPTFRNGDLASFVVWTQKNIQYPTIAVENNITGKVYLEFIVETDGSLSEIKVLKGVDPALEEEAVRVINASPKWKPGKHNGIPVRVKCNIMIRFVLQ